MRFFEGLSLPFPKDFNFNQASQRVGPCMKHSRPEQVLIETEPAAT